MFDLSPIQLVIVLIIALIALGPKRLPEVGRTIGSALREFRGVMSLDGSDDTGPEPERAPATTATTTEAPPEPATRAAAVGGEAAEPTEVAPDDETGAPDDPPAAALESDDGPRPEDLVVRGRRER